MRISFTRGHVSISPRLAFIVFGAWAAALAGCASGSGAPDDGPDARPIDAKQVDVAPPSDAPVIPDAKPLPDLAPPPDAQILLPFGQECQNRSDCMSNICVFTGIAGYCSDVCTSDSCPIGFGCYEVEGAIDSGVISSVCVQEDMLLCTPCMHDTECGETDQDLCLSETTGGSYCARDCSMVSCPPNYTCDSMTIGTTSVMQCVPSSAACDCNVDTRSGTTKPCELTTPFGMCAGALQCQGAQGWSACEPPGTADIPDGNFADENCDGIDGTITDGIFVATAPNGGSDAAGCGLVYTSPCLTISNGALRAVAASRHYVYVQAGEYDETVVLQNGISVFGGYDTMWQRAPRSSVGHDVKIVGQLYGTDNQYVAVVAHNLSTKVTLGDVDIVAPNASGAVGSAARSSYGVHAQAAQLELDRVGIVGGNGAAGAAGGNGMDAPAIAATDGMIGGVGGASEESGATECDTTSHGAGANGAGNSCGSWATGDPTGGNGGNGGVEDDAVQCECTLCFSGDADPGDPGTHAAQFSPNVCGSPGTGGAGVTTCGPGITGQGGCLSNGAGGIGGTAGGSIKSNYWYGFAGSCGTVGTHGGGGGGGGGSGGCDINEDSYGAGGGGGGAGGCAARSGGGGGAGGGGSFGVFAVANSTLTLRDCSIAQGAAGAGGDGGNGGQGQAGGSGGAGGAETPDQPKSQAGGNGGNGNHGGHAGGGGGGAAGVSYGIFYNSSSVDADSSNSIAGGSSVRGGDPGVSAPNAPVHDGNNGTAGAAGKFGPTYACNDANGC